MTTVSRVARVCGRGGRAIDSARRPRRESRFEISARLERGTRSRREARERLCAVANAGARESGRSPSNEPRSMRGSRVPFFHPACHYCLPTRLTKKSTNANKTRRINFCTSPPRVSVSYKTPTKRHRGAEYSNRRSPVDVAPARARARVSGRPKVRRKSPIANRRRDGA